jgi:hypothetical protein
MGADWIATATSLLDAIRALLERRRERDAHVERCLQALREAQYATLSYEAKPVSKQTPEHYLAVARAWDDLADMMRRYDQVLYDRLRLKSCFWRQGADWGEDQLSAAKIGLDQIRKYTELQLIVRQPKPVK